MHIMTKDKQPVHRLVTQCLISKVIEMITGYLYATINVVITFRYDYSYNDKFPITIQQLTEVNPFTAKFSDVLHNA